VRRLAGPALLAIAAVWGLTFVMVQDAIAELPPMAFLAYRFVPAGLLVAVFARNGLRTLGPDGLRAGLVMGAFLTAGYVFQTLGLQHTSASNAGFITGLFVVLTPLFGLLSSGYRWARSPGRPRACRVSASSCSRAPAAAPRCAATASSSCARARSPCTSS
jgi:drug/metabolite transporter (DMT)-like permease